MFTYKKCIVSIGNMIFTWFFAILIVKHVESASLGDFITGILNISLPTNSKNGTAIVSTDKGEIKQSVQMTPIPFLTKIKDINKFSADFMHGDYVAASLDSVDFLETFDNLKWPIKLFLKLAERVLKTIHPIYLAIFPKARNNGTFMDNLIFSASRSGGILQGALKMISVFQ